MRKQVLFVVFTTLVIVSVFAQSGDNANRIIGTWVNNNGNNVRWVFSTNGALTIGNETHRYGATDTVIAIRYNYSAPGTVMVYKYSLSQDGRTLILYTDAAATGTNIWLTK